LAQNNFASSETSWSHERWVEAFETNQIAFEFATLISCVDERNLDRNELFAFTGGKDRQMPCIAGVGWIELDDEGPVIP
jgi:hypothetical protein